MDGNIYTLRSQRAQRIAACACVALTLLLSQQGRAEVPPLLPIEGVIIKALPITVDEEQGAQRTNQPTLVRPGARLLHADRPRLVRPRPRLIDAGGSPMVAVLAAAADADTDAAVTTLSQPTATAATSTGDSYVTVEQALDTKGSVTFRKTPLSEIVFLLSELWHINIVAGENVSGEVSGAFYDAPLREVLTAALAATGYSYRQTGNSLIVLPIDQVGADNPDFASETVRIPPVLKGDDSTLEAAQLLLSERGQLRKIGESLILVVDTPQRITRVRQLFSDLGAATGSSRYQSDSGSGLGDEQPFAVADASPGFAPTAVTHSGIAYFTPQFTEAEQLAEPLREALGESVVVAVYTEENRIMVRGTEDDLRIANEAIEQLDRPRSQVRITAMIYDVSLKEVERLGINWSVRPHSRALALADMNDAESLRFRNLVESTTGLITDPSAPGAANFAVSTINSVLNVDTLLQALNESSEAKLLADPTITVGDRREASIRIVQKIPILAADPVENSGVVFSQVQFEEAGVILNVQPRISRDGTIDMKVNPEYSVVADFIDNNPVIDSRTAETTVRVGDGQMFVLGGLRQKSIVESVRGVPFLKDIKFLGLLFRSHDTEIRESELIVFLKPEVITPYHCGELRQQQAACIASKQLDAIPYAESKPFSPLCKDPYCPNHRPRPRINGGSRGLEMYGCGMNSYQVYSAQETQIIDPYVEQPTPGTRQDRVTPEPTPRHSPGGVVEEVYPPVHIDPRVLTITEAQ